MTFLRRSVSLFALWLGFASMTPALRAEEMPADRVARLNVLVELSSAQQTQALAIFEKEEATQAKLPEGPGRGAKGFEIRQKSRAAIRALLTAEQKKKYDITSQEFGGGLMADPAVYVRRLNQVLTLTPEQRKKASDIIWAELRVQMAALRRDETLQGFTWNDSVRAKLLDILTPEQQAKFDVTPPFGKHATQPAGKRP